MVVTEEVARGGHGGGGPWGVAEDVARTGHGGDGPWGSQRRWPVGGRGGGGPVQVTEVVRAGRGGGGPCRWRRRWSVQVAEETSFRNSESYRYFWVLSYENIVYRHKTEIACKILNF